MLTFTADCAAISMLPRARDWPFSDHYSPEAPCRSICPRCPRKNSNP
ncbi:hypothetical protein [Lysobacter gummosus]